MFVIPRFRRRVKTRSRLQRERGCSRVVSDQSLTDLPLLTHYLGILADLGIGITRDRHQELRVISTSALDELA